jgi:hypothetical protein
MNKAQIEKKILQIIEDIGEDADSLADNRDGIDIMAILFWIEDLHANANRLEDLVAEYEDAEY